MIQVSYQESSKHSQPMGAFYVPNNRQFKTPGELAYNGVVKLGGRLKWTKNQVGMGNFSINISFNSNSTEANNDLPLKNRTPIC